MRLAIVLLALVVLLPGVVLADEGASPARPRVSTSAGTRVARPAEPTSPARRLGRPGALSSRPERARDLGDPAAPPARPSSSDVRFDLALATHVPISVGLEANLRLPLGFLVRAHAGVVPGPYIELLNEIAQGFGAYDDRVGAVVNRATGSSYAIRISTGMRPVPGYGFEVLAGYSLLLSDFRITALDLETITGQPFTNYPGMDSAGISVRMHVFHVELGWSVELFDHLVIRGAIGWAHTLAGEGRVDVPSEVRRRARGIVEDIEGDLAAGLSQYGFTPEARIAVGYQF